jgi:hypothetical protein
MDTSARQRQQQQMLNTPMTVTDNIVCSCTRVQTRNVGVQTNCKYFRKSFLSKFIHPSDVSSDNTVITSCSSSPVLPFKHRPLDNKPSDISTVSNDDNTRPAKPGNGMNNDIYDNSDLSRDIDNGSNGTNDIVPSSDRSKSSCVGSNDSSTNDRNNVQKPSAKAVKTRENEHRYHSSTPNDFDTQPGITRPITLEAFDGQNNVKISLNIAIHVEPQASQVLSNLIDPTNTSTISNENSVRQSPQVTEKSLKDGNSSNISDSNYSNTTTQSTDPLLTDADQTLSKAQRKRSDSKLNKNAEPVTNDATSMTSTSQSGKSRDDRVESSASERTAPFDTTPVPERNRDFEHDYQHSGNHDDILILPVINSSRTYAFQKPSRPQAFLQRATSDEHIFFRKSPITDWTHLIPMDDESHTNGLDDY